MLTKREPSVNTASTCNRSIMSATPSMDVALLQDAGRTLHHLLHGLTFARSLERRGSDIGDGFGIIEFQPLLHASLGDHPQRQEHQLVDLFRCQMHNE